MEVCDEDGFCDWETTSVRDVRERLFQFIVLSQQYKKHTKHSTTKKVVAEEKLINLIYPFTTTAKMATQNSAEVMLIQLKAGEMEADGYTTKRIRGEKMVFTISQGQPSDTIQSQCTPQSKVNLFFFIDKNDNPPGLNVRGRDMATGHKLFDALIGNNEVKIILDKIETTQVYARYGGTGYIIKFNKVVMGEVVTGKVVMGKAEFEVPSSSQVEFEVPSSSQVEFSVPSQVNLPENDTPSVQRGNTKGLESLDSTNQNTRNSVSNAK